MNTKTSHTPGPWTIEEPSKGFDGYIIHGADNVELATLLNTNEKDSNANAALIAAAPDLLQALRHALSRLNAIPHTYEDTDFRLIDNAIAKAQGNE